MKKIHLTCLIIFLASFTFAQEFNKRSNDFYVDTKEAAMGIEAEIPTIIWEEPENIIQTIQGNKTKIRVKVKSNVPIKSIIIDIKRSETSRAIKSNSIDLSETDKYEKTIDQELFLMDGLNTIELIAVNEQNGRGSSYRNIIVGEEAITETILANRKDHALLFATDEYENFDNLINPVLDATTIKNELERNFGFETELVLNPTQNQMLEKLRQYAEKDYAEYNQLFIFIAGHGMYDESFRIGYVVSKNSIRNDEGKSSYLSHSYLRDIINNIPCNHIFLAMDVCFGGTFDQAVASTRSGDALYGDIPKSELIQRKLEFKTRKFLTSGGKQYVPDGRPGHHSPFARRFLEALRNLGGTDRILTLTELYTYVETIDPQPLMGEWGDNEPGSDFIFIAR